MKYSHIFLLLVFSSINVIKSTRDADKQLSSHWILQLDVDNIDEARRLAREHNFNVIRPVNAKLLPGYYVVESEHHGRARRDVDKAEMESLARQLNDHPSVVSFGREKVLSRKKRDYMTPIEQQNLMMVRGGVNNVHALRLGRSEWTEDDPLWPQMWYLNRQASTGLPDMNVSAAWAQGASGRGVSVTFLDDGLEWNHPDLQPNYDPLASTDINSHDDDPMPRYEETNENKHGTRCAGEVAAVANNSVCSVGVAFHAGIGGIRMLDGDVTDSVEASSLSYNSDHVSIYSASWGPDDNGEVVDGPGPLAKKAFVDGVFNGRKGLGNIFVWASGNGGRFNDSCSCDGYANSIYTLSISSVSERGEKPWYLEECASTLATTYSSGDERAGEKEIVTTDLRHKCTTKHTGTSAAAPLAAGIIALTLEVNPRLTWRDIMYLVVVTSRPHAIKSNNYFVNKRGFLVSSRYGFGLMDAGRMVELAKTWRPVPPLQTCSTLNSNYKQRSIQRPNGIEAVLTTDACKRTVNEVNFIEQVEVIVSIKAPRRGALEIYLTSPMGTRHVLLPQRSRDTSSDGFTMWGFTTVQLWGEMPQGDWVLYVNDNSGATIELTYYQLIIHGTKEMPIDYDKYVRPNLDSSDERSNSKCEGSLLEWSDSGEHACTSYCPKGYYADYALARCVKCDQSCLDCSGPGSKSCISCSDDSFLKLDSGECVSECPSGDGYFINSDSQCEKCDLNCLHCKYESTYCQSCAKKSHSLANQTLSESLELTLSHNQCVLVNKLVNCDQGTYYDATAYDQCGFCDITCQTCISSQQNMCLSCSPESRRPYLSQGLCVSECQSGFYQIENERRCFKCHSSCETCELKSNNCLTCKPGYKLDENSQCQATYLYNEKCSDSNCFECHAADPTKCSICKKNYALSDQKCLDKPPEGVYFHSVQDGKGTRLIPSPCPTSCSKCLANSTCIQCADGFHLFPATGQCQIICQEKYFFSSEKQKCLPCDSECETCSSVATKCTKCSSGKFLRNDRCLDRCPLGFFGDLNLGQCLACHPSCETCTGAKKSDCLTCGIGFSFNGQECASTCPETTYFDTLLNECTMCNLTVCRWCIKTANTCTLCADSSFALDESSFTCRPCCSRSIRGKIKYNSTCCQCSNGICLNQTSLDVTISEKMPTIRGDDDSTINSKFYTGFSVLIILIAVCLLIFSAIAFYKSIHRSSGKYSYRYLHVEGTDETETVEMIVDKEETVQ